MNKIIKIIAWVLGLLGLALGIICLATDGSNVDLLLRFTYFLLIAAVVFLIGLAVFMAAKNDPKGLLKALIVLAGIAALAVLAYVLASGAPALNVKTQPDTSMLKLTDTLLLLTAILGGAAVAAIIFGAIRNVSTNK